MRTYMRVSAGVAGLVLAFGLVGVNAALADGPAAVDLLTAGNFMVLSKTGITDTGSHTSSITGSIGASPISATGMNGVFCSEVTGKIYGVDAGYVGSGDQACFAGNPPSGNKTLVDNAVLDMGTAYADAAGRTNPTATELGAGNIGGLTLAPGLYKWSSNAIIPGDLLLLGGASDVWIFQIAGNLDVSSAGSVDSGVKVLLSGGAKASNIYWQVGGVTGATIGTYATFNGNILSAKQIILQTGAVLNGRALSQTQVTLDASIVSLPNVSVQYVAPADNDTAPFSQSQQQQQQSVVETPAAPSAPSAPAAPSQTFNPSAETASSVSIDADKNLTAQATPSTSCPPNTLVKGSGDAVYYCGSNGKRYVFPNSKTYFSWYADFSTVRTVSDATLGTITLGGNATYRPGTRLVKIQSDPKVYAVGKGGELRWVQTEAIASALYGADWSNKVDDVSDAFFVNYTVGAAITTTQ